MRGRFAPTPSGLMHIGNARTALLAWLHIRSAGGQLILRMEDIDKPRSKPEYALQLLEDLKWLGLDWDEGPGKDGACGPYVQSEREERYEAAFRQLMDSGHLYPCYCSRADLAAAASAPHGLASEGGAYPSTCRNMTAAERKERADRKEPAWRFALPQDTGLAFEDLTAGYRAFPAGFGGDFIVKRADGIYGYQLAVVVDDAAMNVTHVLRGWDLLDSTPRQLLLYEALGLSKPVFAHVPLLYGPDGQRLSKRHGSVSIASMREAGTPPEAVVGVLAYLSGLIDRFEPVQVSDLTASFSMEKLSREPVTISLEILVMLSGCCA